MAVNLRWTAEGGLRRGGGTRSGGVTWPRLRLTEDGRHDGYGAPFATRFLPMALDRRGELILSTLGWGRATARGFGPSLASMSASFGAPPVKMKAPKGAVVFGDPSRIVDSARAVA
jgi:hypothetical protein